MSLEFRSLPDAISRFERIFGSALESLLPDLAEVPWLVREHEVVNLFVFRHLIPRFLAENLDISQIGIEMPFQKIPVTDHSKWGRNGDIVVWPHVRATVWRTCKPLAVIEWKNISWREKNPRNLERQHQEDISFSEFNSRLISIAYAVLTDQRERRVRVSCKRIVVGSPATDFLSIRLESAATYSEVAVSKLRNVSYSGLRSRPQDCPDCILDKSAAKGRT